MLAHGPKDIFNHLTGRQSFDYNQITDDVFIGSNMCCQVGFDKELLTKNVRADISLEADNVDAPLGVDYFLWLPTIDNEPPAPDKLAFGVQALEYLVAKKVKVYIHCEHGHGRAPTLFAAYLIKTGMTPDEAVNHIAEKRRDIYLSESQRRALDTFAATL